MAASTVTVPLPGLAPGVMVRSCWQAVWAGQSALVQSAMVGTQTQGPWVVVLPVVMAASCPGAAPVPFQL